MIPVFKPSVGEDELSALKEVFDSGWLGLGPKTKEFEDKFRDFVGAKYCVGLNSGTTALDMAIKLLNIGPGDEVLVPTMTFVSTAHAVAYNGATPVFVDCNKEGNLNLCLNDLFNKINPKTKAIIVVHHGGVPVDLDALENIAGTIPIIEDCAHAVGSYYKGKHVGSRNIGCFSFHAVKNLVMGEGGAITLPHRDLFDRSKKLRWLGIDKGTWDRTGNDKSYWWEYDVQEIGLKGHMHDISAAIGLVQLNKIKEMNSKRELIVERYRKGLDYGISLVNDIYKDCVSSNHLCIMETQFRDELSTYLKDQDICTGVHYKPIHLYPCYGQKVTLKNAESRFRRIITLPIFPDLTEEDLSTIILHINQFIRRKNEIN